jgi:hypothetical protein
LLRMGRGDLIGSSERHLIPPRAPVVPVIDTGINNGRRVAAPKMNTFGKKSAPRVAASTPVTAPTKSGLSYNSAKAKSVAKPIGKAGGKR